MKKDQIIEKWLNRISDDYMHYDDQGKEIARRYAQQCEIKEYEDKGVMMWATIIDIDAIKKTTVLLFYVRPKYRGSKIFLKMIKDIGNISVESGSKEILIGANISNYKEEKFNRVFSHFGYKASGFIKRI